MTRSHRIFSLGMICAEPYLCQPGGFVGQAQHIPSHIMAARAQPSVFMIKRFS